MYRTLGLGHGFWIPRIAKPVHVEADPSGKEMLRAFDVLRAMFCIKQPIESICLDFLENSPKLLRLVSMGNANDLLQKAT